MENPLIITVTLGSYTNRHSIYLPSETPVNNPHDLKIKFYQRGKYAYRTTFRNGQFKPPRNDTQIYVNNKYFFVLNTILKEETKQNISDIIRYCYMFGLTIEEIQTEFKKAYGRV